MSRRTLSGKLFDADPGWVGPKYLKGFYAESDWLTRWQMIQQARNGGSLTPAMMTQLRRAKHSNKLNFHYECQVIEANWQENCWQVACEDGEIREYDRIWLATGTRFDVTAEPLFTR